VNDMTQRFVPQYVYAPTLQLDAQKRQVFDRVFGAALAHSGGGVPLIPYDCPWPKHEFLEYLIGHHSVLVHGSNNDALEELQPRADSDKRGKKIRAVFASSDSIRAMFFAIVDKKPYGYSLNHDCRRELDETGWMRRAYHFSTSTLHDHPWTNGTVYILPGDTFVQEWDSEGDLDFEFEDYEWASRVAVRALAKLTVTPADFPFLDDVQYHEHPPGL
jgi:hypothetical protein